jgi:RecJ-like exonuclease
MLPGRRDDGAATCRDCAGITRGFTCARCGREALLLAGRLCERCTLEEQLAAILDDGTGQVSQRVYG